MSTLMISTIGLLGVAGVYVTFRPSKAGYGAVAIGYTLMTIWLALSVRDPIITGLWSVSAALLAWSWWNSGGGDDTRRRLREAARPFKAVRRTTPVTT